MKLKLKLILLMLIMSIMTIFAQEEIFQKHFMFKKHKFTVVNAVIDKDTISIGYYYHNLPNYSEFDELLEITYDNLYLKNNEDWIKFSLSITKRLLKNREKDASDEDLMEDMFSYINIFLFQNYGIKVIQNSEF